MQLDQQNIGSVKETMFDTLESSTIYVNIYPWLQTFLTVN
jgi:hypothetical protein